MKSKPKILVVDDNPTNVRLLEAFLEPLGYDISTAQDGETALKVFDEENIDLILLDIIMPGIDGFEVARRIRENKENQYHYVPIVFLTALNDTKDRIKGIEAGGDDFLSKPFDRLELMARLKSLLKIKYLNVKVQNRNELLYKIMNSYIVEETLKKTLDNPDKYLKLGGEKCYATILFADLRGFTNFSEKHSHEEIIKVLNNLFPKWMNAVLKNKGTFDKYLGDGIMAFFTAAAGDEVNAFNALLAAREIKYEFDSMDYIKSGIGLGIGINSGEVFVGNVGSDTLMQYTVIGDPVNTAQRIESKALPGQILLSENTYRLLGSKIKVNEIPTLELKGKDLDVAVFELVDMAKTE